MKILRYISKLAIGVSALVVIGCHLLSPGVIVQTTSNEFAWKGRIVRDSTKNISTIRLTNYTVPNGASSHQRNVLKYHESLILANNVGGRVILLRESKSVGENVVIRGKLDVMDLSLDGKTPMLTQVLVVEGN